MEEAASVIGKFPGSDFEGGIYTRDDLGIEAGAGHAEEAAGRGVAEPESADSDAEWLEARDLRSGPLQVYGDLHLAGEDVGGSAWQNGERHAGVQHTVRDFVDGAVAAGRNDQVATEIDFPADLFGGGAGPVSGDERCLDAALREQRGDTVKRALAAREPAGDGIVDDSCAFSAG